MRWATSTQWYRSSMPVCLMYNRHDKKWRDVSNCTKGVNRDATSCCVVAIWIMLCNHLQDGMADIGVSCSWG